MRPVRILTGAALVVALSACGGGGPETLQLEDASPACAEAFAAADEQRPGGGQDESSTLLALQPTLQACRGHDDWLAGARAYPQTLPDAMDRDTALRLLCDGDHEPAPCQPLESPSDPGRG